jgi:hypothetical protein
MKTLKIQMLCLGIALSSVVLLTQCNSNPSATKENADTASATNAMSNDDMIKRGEYLVLVASCDDCHSPKVFNERGEPQIDLTKRLSGHPADAPLPKEFNAAQVAPGKVFMCAQDLTAWYGPWGTSFPRNLTPDSATGIGAWSAETFINILRSGKHMGASAGRPIMPPMPWMNYAKMTDDDLKAMHAFLMSLKPINNNVPEYIPPSGAEAGKKS